MSQPATVSSLMFLDEVVQDFLCCRLLGDARSGTVQCAPGGTLLWEVSAEAVCVFRIRLADWISTAQSPQLDVADHCLVYWHNNPRLCCGPLVPLRPSTRSQSICQFDSTDLCKATSHNCMHYTISNSHSNALQLQLPRQVDCWIISIFTLANSAFSSVQHSVSPLFIGFHNPD